MPGKKTGEREGGRAEEEGWREVKEGEERGRGFRV